MSNSPSRNGPPRWMVSFGNMMSLFALLFIILLSTSKMDLTRFKDAASSLKDAFGVKSFRSGHGKADAEPTGNTAFAQEVILVHVLEKLRILLAKQLENGEAEILESDRGFTLRMSNDKLFNKETFALTSEANEILQSFANLLAGIHNIIYVNGHTDNVPANPNGPYPSNWAISAVQAAAVVNFLATKGGIESSRLQVRANGEYAPLASNEAEDGRVKNRRLEILISRDPMPPTAKESTPATKK